MGTEPVYKGLKEARERARTDRSTGRGQPPIRTYWLLRQHGSEMIAKLVNDGWTLRGLARHFDVSFNTVQSALDFIQDHEELVASADWKTVEATLFGNWPDYQNLPFYRELVGNGYDAYMAALKKRTVQIGRPRGSRNKPKAAATNAQNQPIHPSISEPNPNEPGRGSGSQTPVLHTDQSAPGPYRKKEHL